MAAPRISRRFFMAAASAAAGLSVLPGRVLALTEAAARALVEAVVADINRVIASGKSESAMLKEFEKIFVRYADVPIMARYVLGVDARRISPAQLRAFTAAFQGYISRKYGRRFREFIGGRVEVTKARKIRAGYEVRSMVYLRGEAPFEVSFLVSDKSGRDKFFNMFIEGVNLLLTERTEIGAMIDRRRGDIDKVIADLKRAG